MTAHVKGRYRLGPSKKMSLFPYNEVHVSLIIPEIKFVISRIVILVFLFKTIILMGQMCFLLSSILNLPLSQYYIVPRMAIHH